MYLWNPVSRLAICCGLAASVAVAASTSARAQEVGQSDLRWRLQPGQTIRYRFHQISELKLQADGKVDERLNDLTIEMTWKVESVAEDGATTITQTLDRVRAAVKAGEDSILFDSEQNKVEGPAASSLSELYGAALGAPYTLSLSPDGRVVDAKVPEAVSKALQSSPYQSQADGGSVFSVEGLKKMFAQALPKLPGGSPSVGETWREPLVVPSGPLVMTLDTRYKLVGVDEEAATTIHAQIDTTVEPRPGVALEVEVKSQSGEGDYTFNAKLGRLTRTAVKQTFELGFESNAQKTEQGIAITIRFEEIGEGE